MKKLTLIFLSFFILSLEATASDVFDIQRNIESQYKDTLRTKEMEHRTNFKKGEKKSVSPESFTTIDNESKRYFEKIEIIYTKIPGISNKKIKALIKEFSNKHIGKTEIEIIQKRLQQLYLDAGYGSARIYIDANTIPQGVLTYIVKEGYIEDVVFQKPSGEKYSKFSTALQSFSFYPLAKEALLNIRDLDQGLEQINRLSSSNAFMEIHPGQKDGYSVIIITNDTSKRVNLSISADNSGLENTGIYKANTSISIDNLLMLNDNFYFNYSRNIDGNWENKTNNSYFASLTIPFGYFTFMSSVFKSDYNTPSGTSFGDKYISDGSTQNENFNLEMVLKRSQTYKFSTGLELALKETENFIDNQKIDISSKKLTVGSAFLTGTYYLQSSMIYGKLSYYKGLEWFDAVKNFDIDDTPKGQFNSFSLYLQYSNFFSIPLINLPVSYILSGNGQYSNDILYGSEQTSIGGQNSVRGYKEGSVSGDSGFYLRNDLSCPISEIIGINGLWNILHDTKLSIFADYGYAKNNAYKEIYQLAGGGLGMAYRTKYFNASILWSKSIYNDSNLKDEGNVLYFNIELRIFL